MASLSVRVAANITELRANLKEGVVQIESTKAAMSSMANAFDGSKIIAQAGAVQAQIQALGGVTNLTAGEQARANRVLEDALAKYQALGREAPPGMRELATATKQVDTTSSTLTTTIKGLALSFGAMFTARAAFNFVKDTVREAGALKDLAQQTHINVEELQILAGAMSEFGVDADTLAKGLFTLSRKVAGGDESVEKALAKMGMSLKDLDGLNGQELFLKVERGLAKLQGGMRDDVSSEIFGSRLGMAMAGASEDIEAAIATWRAHNQVISEESVAALDAYDEAIKRAEKSIGAMVANAIGPLAEGFNAANTAATQGATYWQFLTANLKDTFDATLGLGTGTEHLAGLMDQMNQKAQAQAKTIDAGTDVVIEQSGALSAAQQAWNRAAEAADNAAESSRIFGDGLPIEETHQMASAVTAASEADAAYRLNLKFTSEALDERAASLKRVADAAAAAEKKTTDFMTASTLNDRVNSATSSDLSSLKGYAKANAVSRFRQAGDSEDQALQRGLEQLSAKEGTYAPKDNAAYFNMQKDQALLAQLRLWMREKSVPGFASGVEDFSGGVAMVGERGPELVRLPGGSDVIPNHKLAGGTVNNFNFNLSGMVGNPQELSRVIQDTLMQSLRSGLIQLPSGA